MSTHTFLWHDYETFGIDTRRDRPSQFAAIRTDAELNEIGAPIMLYCQPADDYLPDPQSCLITGITPQQCLAEGVPEHRFAATIEAALG
ncbi:MAG: exonuclease domain-containing protein, partial [Pseudomonadota bacterium]|nr:exonuclease domain-containing protein [Pseudomonadota bacterium]